MLTWSRVYRIERRILKKHLKLIKMILLCSFLLSILFISLQISIYISAPSHFKPEPGELLTSSNSEISFQYSSSMSYIKKVTMDGHDVTKKISASKERIIIPAEYLSEGNHEIEIVYHPKMAIWDIKKRWTFSVDTSFPIISISLPGKKEVYTTNKSFIIKGKTEVISKVKIDKDGKIFDIKTDDTGDFQKDFILKEGKNIFRITSTDRAGNKSSYQIKAFFDSTAPKLSSPFPPDGKIVKEVDPLISVTVSEDSKINKIDMRINGKPVSAELVNSSIIKYKPEKLVEGTHNIEVEVENAVGLKDLKKWAFTVDSTEHYGQRTQILGAIGQDVKDLQRMLVLHNYLGENDIKGTFDQKTLEAVKKFQGKNGLEPDGVVGPSTIDKLSYSIIIDLAQFNLALVLDGKVVKNYLIACGSPEYPTPTGEFIITNKVKDPTWIPPDSPWAKEAELTEPGPDNPLGTRWIELNSSLVGIHGTNYPETVGMNVSHGCVRMAIPDVEELYDYVNIGTRVTIRDPILPPTPTARPAEPTTRPDKKPVKKPDNTGTIYIEKKNY